MADLEISIGADPSEFEAGVKKAQKSAQDFEKDLKQTGLTGAESFALLANGITATIQIIEKLAHALSAPIEAFREAELANNKLRLSLENQGLPVDELTKKYSVLAAELQAKTGVDDDAIKSNLALLQSMIGQQEITPKLAALLVDLGEQTGSMEEAATKLGKAINGNSTALKKMGFDFDDTGTRAQRTEKILAAVGSRVDGLAEAGNKGLGGIRGLKSSFQDFLESVGEQFAPVISEIIVGLKELTEVLTHSRTIKDFAQALATIIGYFIQAISYTAQFIAQIDRLASKITSALPAFLKFGRASGAPQPGAESGQGAQVQQSAADAKRSAAAKEAADKREAIRVAEEQRTVEGQTQLQEKILAKNADFQALSAEQQAAFLKANHEALDKAFLSEEEARTEAINRQLKIQIEANNRFLEEQKKYGTAYAKISQAMHSTEVQGAKQATGELTQLQQSNNATLKAIGKAAAIAQITIKTSESAMNIFAGFSTIPIVGIPLGIAGAAAAVAFGAEQIAGVLSAQEGGVVPGVSRGRDSVPMIAEPGELVVPRASFSEVVNAVASQRAGSSAEATSGVRTAGGGGGTEVVARLEFSGDNAEKFLTARQVEARKLGILREART